MYIKDMKVTNDRNVLVHIPQFIVKKWNLKDNDYLEVHITDDEQAVEIRPRKRIQAGSGLNDASEEVSGNTE